MKSKDRIIIQKIINYIEDVEKYVEGIEPRDFLDDRKTIMACAFSVMQIGELTKEITEETTKKLEKIKKLCEEINEIENIDYVETRYYADNKIIKTTTIKYK